MRSDEVLAELMSSSGDRLLRLAYQLYHDRAGAEDLVQEALTRVYGSWLRRAPRVEHAEAYVRRAVVNEYLRTRRLRASSELVTDEVPDRPDDGFDAGVVNRDELWDVLAVLPARQRAVLVLRFYALTDRPAEVGTRSWPPCGATRRGGRRSGAKPAQPGPRFGEVGGRAS